MQLNLINMIQALDRRLHFIQNHLDKMNSNFYSLIIDISSQIDTFKHEMSYWLDSIDDALLIVLSIQVDKQASHLYQVSSINEKEKNNDIDTTLGALKKERINLSINTLLILQ